jgi:hypothetical protein
MVTEQRSTASDAVPSWTQDTELVMAIAMLILSQYFYERPGWDGPKTVAALRDIVSRLS